MPVAVDLPVPSGRDLIVAGYEIHHLHVHVWPSNYHGRLEFASADQNPDPAVLDANAEKLRAAIGLLATRSSCRELSVTLAPVRPVQALPGQRGPAGLGRRERLVKDSPDPLFGDGIGRSEFDGEEAHPQLFDHPARLD